MFFAAGNIPPSPPGGGNRDDSPVCLRSSFIDSPVLKDESRDLFQQEQEISLPKNSLSYSQRGVPYAAALQSDPSLFVDLPSSVNILSRTLRSSYEDINEVRMYMEDLGFERTEVVFEENEPRTAIQGPVMLVAEHEGSLFVQNSHSLQNAATLLTLRNIELSSENTVVFQLTKANIDSVVRLSLDQEIDWQFKNLLNTPRDPELYNRLCNSDFITRVKTSIARRITGISMIRSGALLPIISEEIDKEMQIEHLEEQRSLIVDILREARRDPHAMIARWRALL